MPDFGFGEIFPFETKILRVYFSPDKRDIPNYEIDLEKANTSVVFKLTVTTIKSLGGIKKSMDYRRIRKSLEYVEKLIHERKSDPIEGEILNCLDALREKPSEVSITEENFSLAEIVRDEILEYLGVLNKEFKVNEEYESDPVKSPLIPTNSIWIEGKITDPLCDISHQVIEFPDTPCGSYTLMTVKLRAMKHFLDFTCSCGYLTNVSKIKKHLKYEAIVEVCGNNPLIRVEPTCCNLSSGDVETLVFITRPQLPSDVVYEKAKVLKVQELIEKKREEYLLKREKEKVAKLAKQMKKKDKKRKKGKGGKEKSDKGKKEKKGGKGKKGKKGKGKKSEKSDKSNEEVKEIEKVLPEFTVDDSEITINYSDLYPAEMAVWKSMDPYFIYGTFTCTLTYNSHEIDKNVEKLYIETSCKVIRPDFILNLNYVDFGPVALGSAESVYINVENIKNARIEPTISYLNPIGVFKCPNFPKLGIEAESVWKLPVTFEPPSEETYNEYFEVTSGRTTSPVTLIGEGVRPEIIITPDFIVCHLEAKTGTFADCQLELSNKCRASITMTVEKVCELVGEIKEKPKEEKNDGKEGKKGGKNKKSRKGKSKGSEKSEGKKSKEKKSKDKKSKSKKSKASKKSKSAKGKKPSKYSKELTEDEFYSLENFFLNKDGESYFEVVTDDSRCKIGPFSKTNVKIRFGVPLTPEEKEESKSKKKSKKSSKKSSKDSKKSGKSSKKSGKSSKKSSRSSKKKGKVKGGKEVKLFYVAKFNLLLGTSTYLKDFLVIATFI